ncbi:MAG: hypothetical protein U5K81_02570 [Trueperaceae bacterium]|nr:hypothetical protein [Trueperaceae bacterium]
MRQAVARAASDGADPERPSTTLDITVVDTGGTFDVTTDMTFEQRDVEPGNLQQAPSGDRATCRRETGAQASSYPGPSPPIRFCWSTGCR